jgi:hypothetical protein
MERNEVLRQLRNREVEILTQLISRGESPPTDPGDHELLTELEDIEDALDAEEARQNPSLLEKDLIDLLGEKEGKQAMNFLAQHKLRRPTDEQ